MTGVSKKPFLTLCCQILTMRAMSRSPSNGIRTASGAGPARLALILLIGAPLLLAPTKSDRRRIVCLTPAATQMARELGAADRIVAVGAYDPVAPDHAAVVGDLYRVDYEKLLRAEPTDLIIQQTEQRLPRRLRALADRNGWRMHRYRIETADDVLRTLAGPRERWATDADDAHPGDGSERDVSGSDTPDDHATRPSIGSLLGQQEAATKLARLIDWRLTELAKLTAPAEAEAAPRVLMLVGLEPMTAVGRGTFLHEMLTAAGGRNVLEEEHGPYPVLDRERLLRLEPEVILLVGSNTALLAGDSGDRSGGSGGDGAVNFDPPEALEARVLRIGGRTALLPSTTMDDTAAAMARKLHPALSERIDRLMEMQEPPRDEDAARP